MKTCPECGGEGQCEYEVSVPSPMSWRGGWLEDRLLECELCGGSGEIKDDEEQGIE